MSRFKFPNKIANSILGIASVQAHDMSAVQNFISHPFS